MKHLFRFHGQRSGAGDWELIDDEWHHLLKVLRLQAGDPLELTDGQGWVAQATLAEVGKHKGFLHLDGEVFYPRALRQNELTLGLGILKPQGIDEVLPGLVEMGVHRLLLIPFFGMDKARVSDKLLDRWQRQIVAASKQAKAPWFPELRVMKSFEAFLLASSEYSRRYLLDPQGDAGAERSEAAGPILAVIGSEAGWNAGEVEQFAAAGFQKLRLKSHVLRATTAVLATAAILKQNMPES